MTEERFQKFYDDDAEAPSVDAHGSVITRQLPELIEYLRDVVTEITVARKRAPAVDMDAATDKELGALNDMLRANEDCQAYGCYDAADVVRAAMCLVEDDIRKRGSK